jgi:murein peptide amidase A
MDYVKTFTLGHTAQSLPIPAYKFGNDGAPILIVGGVHGDEIEGIQAAYAIVDRFLKSYTLQLQITVVPCLNMDGMLAKNRRNGNGVDLNRNLPTLDWSPLAAKEAYHPGASANSEPENKALTTYIESTQPKFILSLHSWIPLLNVNGDCRKMAQIISSFTGYIITDDIGYPTPGSLGTYTGMERSIPTLTYEFERQLDPKIITGLHVDAILEGLKIYE